MGQRASWLRQSTYLRALQTVPGLTVHLGHFLTSTVRTPLARPVPGGARTVEVVKTEEKGSDVNLATYLLADAFRADVESLVVVSNDSDLMEPIRLVMGPSSSPRPGDKAEAPPKRGIAPSYRSAWGDTQKHTRATRSRALPDHRSGYTVPPSPAAPPRAARWSAPHEPRTCAAADS